MELILCTLYAIIIKSDAVAINIYVRRINKTCESK